MSTRRETNDVCLEHAGRLASIEARLARYTDVLEALKSQCYRNKERLIAIAGEDGRNGKLASLEAKMTKLESAADKMEQILNRQIETRAADRVKIAGLVAVVTTVATMVGGYVLHLIGG